MADFLIREDSLTPEQLTAMRDMMMQSPKMQPDMLLVPPSMQKIADDILKGGNIKRSKVGTHMWHPSEDGKSMKWETRGPKKLSPEGRSRDLQDVVNEEVDKLNG